MRHLFLSLFLFTACANAHETVHIPDDGEDAGEDELLTCDQLVAEDTGPVAAATEALTLCETLPAPLSSRRTMKDGCKTCPLVWAYLYAPSGYTSKLDLAAVQHGAQLWYDALGWKVIGVDPIVRTSLTQIPAGALVIERNDSYTMPSPSTGGYEQQNAWGCNRSRIRISTNPGNNAYWNYIIKEFIYGHEMGHNILNMVGHSEIRESLMYWATDNDFIEQAYVNQLNSTRQFWTQ